MRQLDTDLFHTLSGDHFESLAPVLLAAAEHGAWISATLLVWVVLRHPQERWYVFVILLAAAVASMLAQYIARELGLPRPFMLGLIESRIDHGARGAMPSAHASVMFTVALLLLHRAALRGVGLIALALALVTCWGRVYAGVHFPFDIVGGLLLAIVLSTAIGWLAVHARALWASAMTKGSTHSGAS